MAALERHRTERPSRVALDDGSGTLLYGDLPGAIEERRARLLETGVHVLAIGLDNGIDWVLWDLAAAAAGVVCIPIPPFFTPSQRGHIQSAAGVDALISPRGLERLDNRAVALPHGTGKITFTSGSTGAPKGVCLSFEGLQRVAGAVFEAVGPVGHQHHFSALPLAVLLENVAGVYAALLAGCRIDVPPRALEWMNPGALLRGLGGGANTVILVPELLRALMAVMHHGEIRLPDLAFAAVGGARVAPGLIEQARLRGLAVYQGYGLSECGSVVALNTPGADRRGSVGRVLRHVDLRIDDGEIVVANPLFLGYLGTERDGPLRTGDLGELDEEGFLSVKGRRSQVLITSYGRNVSPEWAEAELLAQPAVMQAVVCGDGWPGLGALITAGEGVGDAALERAVEAANAALPDYARVAGWLRVPRFSREDGFLSAAGGLCRQHIVQHYLEELESQMNHGDFYERLLSVTTRAREELYAVSQLRDGLRGRISLDTYIAYLTEAYHHVRHTVPFLMAMGARLPAGMDWLREAVIRYINEEKGHEEWILCDIKAAGGDPDEVRASTPRLETQVLVAYNYDYIQRKNPLGFLGMVFMLESTSTQIATRGASSIQGALELPDEAFTYLYSHGELDREHMTLFRTLVNRIDDTGHREAIIEVACNTFRLFAGVLRSIPHPGEVQDVA